MPRIRLEGAGLGLLVSKRVARHFGETRKFEKKRGCKPESLSGRPRAVQLGRKKGTSERGVEGPGGTYERRPGQGGRVMQARGEKKNECGLRRRKTNSEWDKKKLLEGGRSTQQGGLVGACNSSLNSPSLGLKGKE